MQKNKTENEIVARPPVVVIMGHVDHGKSTLLDYIRKTNIVETEAGGITQKISAYEVEHKGEDGKNHKITFLDTPGHEAFTKMRERGAQVADIAILIVSAEDGVKTQTVEAWKTIEASKTPVIVAINKIDRPGANIEKTKGELAEHGIYIENYGGSIPCALISAKTGEGVDSLLSLILILAEIENFTGKLEIPARGLIIEAHLDPRRGIEASLVIKEGTIKKGMVVATGESMCSVRIVENFLGKSIDKAEMSSPIRLIGFDKMPKIGEEFQAFQKKSEAEEYLTTWKEMQNGQNKKLETTPTPKGVGVPTESVGKKIIPVVVKADVSGSLEAIEREINKITSNTAMFKIVASGEGPIGEKDLKSIAGSPEAIVIGFNVKADASALELAERAGIKISFFNIIYKMAEFLAVEMETKKPKIETAETTGVAKILKAFSRTKERQIVGGKVLSGKISLDSTVKIMRRDFEIGRGKIVNLEKGKTKTSNVEEGSEFGMMIESKTEIVGGDTIEAFTMVQK